MLEIFQSKSPAQDFDDEIKNRIYWLAIPNTELFWTGNVFGPVHAVKIFHKWQTANHQKESLLKQLGLSEITTWCWQSEYFDQEVGKLVSVELDLKDLVKWNLHSN